MFIMVPLIWIMPPPPHIIMPTMLSSGTTTQQNGHGHESPDESAVGHTSSLEGRTQPPFHWPNTSPAEGTSFAVAGEDPRLPVLVERDHVERLASTARHFHTR